MRTGTTTTMLQQISEGFVNKKMTLMAKKNDKIPSGNPPCDVELMGILLFSSSCFQKAFWSASFRSGGGGSSIFNIARPWNDCSLGFFMALIRNDVLVVECVMPHSIQTDDIVGWAVLPIDDVVNLETNWLIPFEEDFNFTSPSEGMCWTWVKPRKPKRSKPKKAEPCW